MTESSLQPLPLPKAALLLSDFAKLNGGQLLIPVARRHPSYWRVWPGPLREIVTREASPLLKLEPGLTIKSFVGPSSEDWMLPGAGYDWHFWSLIEELAADYPLDGNKLSRFCLKTLLAEPSPEGDRTFYTTRLPQQSAWFLNVQRLIDDYTACQLDGFAARAGLGAFNWQGRIMARAAVFLGAQARTVLLANSNRTAAEALLLNLLPNKGAGLSEAESKVQLLKRIDWVNGLIAAHGPAWIEQ